MYSINKNQEVQQQVEQPKETRGYISTFFRDAFLLAGSVYGNGYATMHGPLVVKNGIQSYLNAYAPSYFGSGLVNTYTAYTQAAAITPYLGAAGSVVGGAGALIAYTVAEKVVSFAAKTLYNSIAGTKEAVEQGEEANLF